MEYKREKHEELLNIHQSTRVDKAALSMANIAYEVFDIENGSGGSVCRALFECLVSHLERLETHRKMNEDGVLGLEDNLYWMIETIRNVWKITDHSYTIDVLVEHTGGRSGNEWFEKKLEKASKEVDESYENLSRYVNAKEEIQKYFQAMKTDSI